MRRFRTTKPIPFLYTRTDSRAGWLLAVLAPLRASSLLGEFSLGSPNRRRLIVVPINGNTLGSAPAAGGSLPSY